MGEGTNQGQAKDPGQDGHHEAVLTRLCDLRLGTEQVDLALIQGWGGVRGC